MLRNWARLWNVPALKQVEIRINPRLRTSLGRCVPRLTQIELNPSLLHNKHRRLQEVLCHEAAHIASWVLESEQKRAHNSKWAQLMTAAGFKAKATIPGLRCNAQGRAVRDEVFEHYCPVCRFTRVARRPVTQWKCRTCVTAGLSGKLRIRARSSRGRSAV